MQLRLTAVVFDVWRISAENVPAVTDAETFDVIDLAEQVKKQRWWNKMFGKNSGPAAEKYSVATQLAIGGVTGWWVMPPGLCHSLAFITLQR